MTSEQETGRSICHPSSSPADSSGGRLRRDLALYSGPAFSILLLLAATTTCIDTEDVEEEPNRIAAHTFPSSDYERIDGDVIEPESKLTFSSAVEIIGDLEAAEVESMHDVVVHGSYTVHGNNAVCGNQRTGGDHYVSGGNKVCGYQDVGGNQWIGKYQRIGKHQDVGGDQYVGGSQKVGGDQNVGRNQFVTYYQVISGDQTIGRDQWVGGTRTVHGTSSVGGNSNH